jgi:hypothetical protein
MPCAVGTLEFRLPELELEWLDRCDEDEWWWWDEW